MDIQAFRRVDDVEVFGAVLYLLPRFIQALLGFAVLIDFCLKEFCWVFRFLDSIIFFSLPSSVLPDLFYFHLAVLRDWG